MSGIVSQINPFLEKLKIKAYRHKNRDSINELGTFKAMFNPESYSLTYENYHSIYQGINTSGREAKFSNSKNEKLSLKLILDNTGVADYDALGFGTFALAQKFSGTTDVYHQITRFLKLTKYINGEIHQPNFLKVEWGDLIFDCKLESVEINYTLFNRSGQPLRAELNTVFIGDIEDSKRIKKENKRSPDLTHLKTVKAGDKLPLMAQEVYNNPAYYIQLAQANNLNNFRKLKTGTTINLPPIKK